MHMHAKSSKLPAWLWFFLALPLGLFVMLLYRGKRLPRLGQLAGRLPTNPRPRYSEPDSIPLNMVSEYTASRAPVVGVSTQSEDELDAERMDFESPASSYTSSTAASSGNEQEISLPDLTPAPEAAAPEAAAPEAAAPETAAPEVAAPAAAPVTEDDLKRIEGIGPVIAGLLRENGIFTFRQLADTPTERLTALLTEARLNRLSDPATWPEQARLAAEGQWDALEQLQASLKGGRRTG